MLSFCAVGKVRGPCLIKWLGGFFFLSAIYYWHFPGIGWGALHVDVQCLFLSSPQNHPVQPCRPTSRLVVCWGGACRTKLTLKPADCACTVFVAVLCLHFNLIVNSFVLVCVWDWQVSRGRWPCSLCSCWTITWLPGSLGFGMGLLPWAFPLVAHL